MAAKKTTRKTATSSKAATGKPGAKTVRKKTAGKKAATSKKAAARKATGRKATGKKSPAKAAGSASISSTAVNMGNVFALRPRVSKTFRQEDFLKARRLLEEESYASIEEAARAVVERALALTNETGGKPGRKRGF